MTDSGEEHRMRYEGQIAETVMMRGHEGDVIDAYLARPLGAVRSAGVVVIHHMPGWDVATKEIGRRFAHHGFVALSPNLHFREGKATPEENSASVRAAGGMPDDRTMGDVQGAIDYLRALPYLNGKVGVIGYCSGGGVVAKPEELTPRQPVAPIDFTKDLQCPLLGLFGVEDTRPSPDDTTKTEAALKQHNKTYEFHTYDNAGHAFFAVDRPVYRQHAAIDGWQKVLAWFGKHLA